MTSTGSSFRVKIPRPRTAEVNALETARPMEQTTDVPGTFITALPPLPEASMRELEVRPVNPPYSYSRISYNDRTKEYLYEVIEPQLSAHEKGLVAHLKSTLNQILGSETANLSTADKRSYLRGEAEEYFRSRGDPRSPPSPRSGSSTTCSGTSSGTDRSTSLILRPRGRGHLV